MLTDKERCEIAARLRDYDNLRESLRESPICAFLGVLGVEGYMNWKGVCNLLANLIEPEPERTCRNEAYLYAPGLLFVCSECTRAIDEYEHVPLIGEYCTCGAKRVD